MIGPGPDRGPIDHTSSMLTGPVIDEEVAERLSILKNQPLPGMHQIR